MSVVQLPKYAINGLDPDEEAARLHFKKNQPDQPDIDFPPYEFRPFPCAIYRRRSEDDPLESKLVGSEAERRAHLEQGWALHPDETRTAQFQLDRVVARHAAERAAQDTHLRPKARAELDALEDASEDHVVDPVIPKKRGRPKKETADVA